MSCISCISLTKCRYGACNMYIEFNILNTITRINCELFLIRTGFYYNWHDFSLILSIKFSFKNGYLLVNVCVEYEFHFNTCILVLLIKKVGIWLEKGRKDKTNSNCNLHMLRGICIHIFTFSWEILFEHLDTRKKSLLYSYRV